MKSTLFILALGTIISGMGGAAGAPPNLIAHYRLNDNLATDVIVDQMGNHNGAVKDAGGTATSAFHSVAGLIKTAQEFDGTDDYIEITDHADFTPAGTSFSISAWVNMDDASNFMIANKGVFGTDGEWRLFTGNSDNLFFRAIDESAGARIGRSSLAITTYENQWTHIVGTYDGGALSSGINLYVNAINVDTADSKLNVFVSCENLNHDIWIGNYNGNYANGTIDNIMFFAAELTQDEVNILYNNGAATEIPAELDQMMSPRRANLSPFSSRRRYEY